MLLRLAIFGSRKNLTIQQSNNGASDEEQTVAVLHIVSLPSIVYIYRKNELLKCKLLEVKSFTSQVIQVVDKEWESAVEFNSFSELFESYQQKFVRKQDRIRLPTVYDGWKLFSVKINSEYINLYDIINKASSVGHFGFTDKSGYPIYLPPIGPVRSADADKRKRIQDAKEERKRKRDAAIAKLKAEQANEPPYSDSFVPFPEFDKEIFKVLVAAPIQVANGLAVTASHPNSMIVD
jgi:hypothetical protein